MGGVRTMRGDRLHISVFGNRNAGKSSIINAIAGQEVSIVSDIPGTTADPVYRTMELRPVGPVVFIDTAGLDDCGSPLGTLRVKRSRDILLKTDIAIVVIPADSVSTNEADVLIRELAGENILTIVAVNKTDLGISEEVRNWHGIGESIFISAKDNTGIDRLRERIIEIAPKEWEPPFVGDLISPGDIVLLVTPIDLGAPKGRMIMPQVKAIREILDSNGIPVICKESELTAALARLGAGIALVITDSQVFSKVASEVPADIPLTSFSILSARQKGDLGLMIKGVQMIDELRPGDQVLIAEACTHHPSEDDIARVKIPAWLSDRAGGKIETRIVQGNDFPGDLSGYRMIIHCGACTLSGKEMKNRIRIANESGIPITNFGIVISFLKSVFPRAILPFSEHCNVLETDSKEKNMRKRGIVSGTSGTEES